MCVGGGGGVGIAVGLERDRDECIQAHHGNEVQRQGLRENCLCSPWLQGKH